MEIHGPDTLYWLDVPHLFIPGMGRVSMDADNQGVTFEVERARVSKTRG